MLPAALVLLMLIGWLTSPPLWKWLWPALVLGIFLIPAVFISIHSASRRAVDVPWLGHLRHVGRSLGKSLIQAILSIAFLPYEAYVSLDAIVRTMVRMRWTHGLMLEWKTASDTERDGHHGLAGAYRTMCIAPTLSVSTAALLAFVDPNALLAASPVLVLWMVAPLLAWIISCPDRSSEVHLTNQQRVFLHQLARKTWRFFQRFVGPEDHWLPPDNYQEVPTGTVAHRTSPTNIGVSLISTLAAYDFGYISAGRLIDRTRNTLSTMTRLERFHGHFLNWYDTRTLEPLLPKYVSSVDSGNLAGHLLILRAGLLEIPANPLVVPELPTSLSLIRRALEEAAESTMVSKRFSASELALFEELIKFLSQHELKNGVVPSLRATQDCVTDSWPIPARARQSRARTAAHSLRQVRFPTAARTVRVVSS
jgi:hypothetical protein